jgi:hypothetical protein
MQMNGILPAPPSGPPHASCALAGRAAIERELRSLSAQRERLEAGNAAPAAPSGELADDPLGLSELKRRQRVASDRLGKLDQQISTRTRALPLYEELLGVPDLGADLRLRRDHPAHTLLRRMYYESRSAENR